MIYLCSFQKINEKNTWELPLIDHLSDVFKNNDNQDAQCNFQMVCLPGGSKHDPY